MERMVGSPAARTRAATTAELRFDREEAVGATLALHPVSGRVPDAQAASPNAFIIESAWEGVPRLKISSVHAAANALRRVRMLDAADKLLYTAELTRNRSANARFRTEHPSFVTPPPPLAFDAYGYINNARYLESGLRDAEVIAGIINRYIDGEGCRVNEWGCGPGRVIRHLGDLVDRPGLEIVGTDYNPDSVEWCNANLDGASFYVNGLAPPLPFSDGRFDCLYALSVFTHLSAERHVEWMDEIARVVRPGGIIVVTTHSDAATDRLLRNELEDYDAGNLVVRGGVTEGKKWYLAYHPPAFVQGELLDGWEIIDHQPAKMFGLQDLWVARR